MLEKLQREVVEAWIKYAKKDLRKMKQKKRLTNNDCYNLGQIDVEIIAIKDWVDELKVVQ